MFYDDVDDDDDDDDAIQRITCKSRCRAALHVLVAFCLTEVNITKNHKQITNE